MTYTYNHIIQFYETDAMQIVHHSNYIRWFEEARIGWLDNFGYSYKRMEDEGISIPVLAVDCKYKKPLEFGDTAEVHVKVDKFTPLRLKLAYEIYHKESGVLTTIGSSEHCFINNETGRPTSLKKTHPDILAAFERAVEESNAE